MAKVIILMADYGHDPTETAVPYKAFKDAGFDVSFATETGKTPRCDSRMLGGITQKLLGASRSTVELYNAMSSSPEFAKPLSWTAPGFSLAPYNLVFLPGGHEKSVRQIIDSADVHALLIDYFPTTAKSPAGGGGVAAKAAAVGAVCHGVMVLSEARRKDGGDGDGDGQSVLHGVTTTTLPGRFEQVAYWGTRAFLGDYYKTYGAGSDDVEDSVRRAVGDASHLKISLSPSPFVVEDDKFNYISARFPGDVPLMAEKMVKLVQSLVAGESGPAGSA
ncbi:FluG domain-containing protein [Purpureocillium lavendulum]|uniref:FluG domain-containing protein n=1 Tax=Purpureocillium lavendulum TaxID=1247861 RepID=A0AB34FPF2_9HYPO|nr:FluG domain-containing protein [Purpureocillium lavendulum]